MDRPHNRGTLPRPPLPWGQDPAPPRRTRDPRLTILAGRDCGLPFPDGSEAGGEGPPLIAYAAVPHRYFDERAERVAGLYDGLFFTVGSWDDGVADRLGPHGAEPVATAWAAAAARNLTHLRRAGVVDNLLGVHFGESAPWPSPETLLSPAYRQKMERHFGRLGQVAAALGFRGVSIDIEYPSPRYVLDHDIYTFDGYGAEEIVAAAADQAGAATRALLDAFPTAVVFLLPGEVRARPVEHAFIKGVLEAMAERDAPGGLHLGYERSYVLYDAATQVAIPRAAHGWLELDLSPAQRSYWRRRCSVAPGIWPLHMAETGATDYPCRPWSEELGELAAQLAILRRVTTRYLWTFSMHPLWHDHGPEAAAVFGFDQPAFTGAREAVAGWQSILASRRAAQPPADPRLAPLWRAVADFDAGRIDADDLCSRFGTPGTWQMIGLLDNPFVRQAFAARDAVHRLPSAHASVHGRDGAVRWFPFPNRDPTGSVDLRLPFAWYRTDDVSAHLACTLETTHEVRTNLCIGWDDGLAVWLDDRLVFDRRAYGHAHGGLLYRDRWLFEEFVPLTIPPGKHRLALTSLNARGRWGFNLRFGDREGYPADGLRFGLATPSGQDVRSEHRGLAGGVEAVAPGPLVDG